MAIVALTNGILLGLSSDTKPTTYPNGTIFFESNTGNAFMYISAVWTAITSATGEANTASNVGTGTGVFKQKSALDLQFKSLTATSSKIALANNTNDVGIDVTEASLTLQNLGGTLTVAKGGTGAATLTGILLGNGTSAVTASNTLAGITLTTPIINGIKGGDVAITNADSPYTALATTRVIRADATSGAITINLPTAVGIAGFEYHVFRTDIIASTNFVILDGSSTETIGGNLTHYLWPGEFVKIESDGANWQVINRSSPSAQNYFMAKGSTINRRYCGSMPELPVAQAASNVSPAANTLWAFTFVIPRTTKFDTGSFWVTTVSTAGNSRVGVYRDNGNNYPGVMLWDSGAVATNVGTGVKDTTITPNLILQPGLYWLAYEQDTATGQYMILPTTTQVHNIMGQASNINSGNVSGYYYSVAHTFGALPDPYTAGATLGIVASAAATPLVCVGLRPI